MTKKQIHLKNAATTAEGAKLRFHETTGKKAKTMAFRNAAVAEISYGHTGDDDRENAGDEAAHSSLELTKFPAAAGKRTLYGNRLHPHHQKEREKTGGISLTRWFRKKRWQKELTAAKAGAIPEGRVPGMLKAAEKWIIQTVKTHPHVLLAGGILIFVLLLIMGFFASCSVFLQSGTNVVVETSFTAEDADILGANDDYCALENAMEDRINRIESAYPNYDEYQYQVSAFDHNPYELTAFLTVQYEHYTRDEVQTALYELFSRQYTLELEEEIEVYYDDDGYTEYRILHVTLTNHGIYSAIMEMGMTDEQWERYRLIMQRLGNREYLFGGDVYASSGGYSDYTVSPEALSDVKFANMIEEAEKYLGYPYVWGGASPATSFDCSGFVCWVINHCGNGWNYGRLTAEGLREACHTVSKYKAKPGDLIFFQGTYDTPGASHVGIYVGDGMMLHCGSPIQYTSIESAYWQQHFMEFGRIL